MSGPHADRARTCRVAKDYQAEYADPIAVEAGEAYTVSDKTSVWENNPTWIWVWCTDQRGKSGWVPRSVIQMAPGDQQGTSPVAYSAVELTVTAGQELSVEQEESGWAWCRDQQGTRGWVPLSHLLAQP